VVDRVPAAVERDRRLRPERAEQLDLLLAARAAVAERLAEGLVLDGVPADADPEPQPAAAEQVDLGGLLGHQHGLPLRQDQHTAAIRMPPIMPARRRCPCAVGPWCPAARTRRRWPRG